MGSLFQGESTATINTGQGEGAIERGDKYAKEMGTEIKKADDPYWLEGAPDDSPALTSAAVLKRREAQALRLKTNNGRKSTFLTGEEGLNSMGGLRLDRKTLLGG